MIGTSTLPNLVSHICLSAHQALSQAPTRLSLIAYFPLLLEIRSNYGPVCKMLIVLFRPSQRMLPTSGLSVKPQKRWLRWLHWVWTRLPKLEYSVQASSARVGLTLWAYRNFDSFWETFPGVPSGTGNFPEVVGVILEEGPVFYRFPLQSLSFLCDPRISVPSLYKYEALPLLNIITFTTHTLSIWEQSKSQRLRNLRIS